MVVSPTVGHRMSNSRAAVLNGYPENSILAPMIIGIAGSYGAGEKAWDAFARGCQLFFSQK